MARPTKYTPELLEKAKEYIDVYNSKYEHAIPSVAGLSIALGVRRETCHVWAKEDGKEEFSNILDTINANQEQILISSGLIGAFNPQITKLVLGKHGYSDKSSQELTGANGEALIPGSIKIEYE